MRVSLAGLDRSDDGDTGHLVEHTRRGGLVPESNRERGMVVRRVVQSRSRSPGSGAVGEAACWLSDAWPLTGGNHDAHAPLVSQASAISSASRPGGRVASRVSTAPSSW